MYKLRLVVAPLFLISARNPFIVYTNSTRNIYASSKVDTDLFQIIWMEVPNTIEPGKHPVCLFVANSNPIKRSFLLSSIYLVH